MKEQIKKNCAARPTTTRLRPLRVTKKQQQHAPTTCISSQPTVVVGCSTVVTPGAAPAASNKDDLVAERTFPLKAGVPTSSTARHKRVGTAPVAPSGKTSRRHSNVHVLFVFRHVLNRPITPSLRTEYTIAR